MKVIGIDLDGTLAQYSEWKGIGSIGDPYPGAIQFLQNLKNDGWTIALWSTRAEIYIKQWVKTHGADHLVDYYNSSPYPSDSLKQSFDLYVGDEVLRFNGNFHSLMNGINELGTARHWGRDSFERDTTESDRNPTIYYRGTGKLYLDVFEGLTEKIWAEHVCQNTAFLTICSHAKPYSKSWIHAAIRQQLYINGTLSGLDYIHISSAGIIPTNVSQKYDQVDRYDWNSADIQKDEVRSLLKDTITSRLLTWYNIAGHKYEKIYVYLRPTGNTLAAVVESEIPVIQIPVIEYESPKWVVEPDRDDCLANFLNLHELDQIEL